MTELFTEEDLISSYSDAQAIEDGMIVDLPAIGCHVTFNGRKVNRMTRHLYEELKPFMIGRSDLASTIRTKLRYARDTAEPGEETGIIYELPPGIWLVANAETGGYTAMWPSDY